MATKKQSSGKQSSDAAKGDSAAPASDETGAEVLHGEPAPEAGVPVSAIDFAALESRVAQADAAHGAAVASVGTTADELREARAALREARGG